MRVFYVDAKASIGLNCDCCVIVFAIKLDVVAEDEEAARKAIDEWKKSAYVGDLSFVDAGELDSKLLRARGVIMVNRRQIFKGYYGDAPKF